jgi:hypothetical protein
VIPSRREDVAHVDAAWAERILAAGDAAAITRAVAEASYHLTAPSDRGLVWVRRCANPRCPRPGRWFAASKRNAKTCTPGCRKAIGRGETPRSARRARKR